MTIRIWTMVLFGAFLNACATSSVEPAPGAVAALAATRQKSVDPNYTATELDKRAREMGYHVESRNGQRGYCRNTAPTGSHISRASCVTADGMARVVKAADDDQDQISQRQNAIQFGRRSASLVVETS